VGGMKDFIFIYGPPASGKSIVGELIAESLGLAFTDLDIKIETKTERTIPQIFATEGEAGFRRIEEEALSEFISEGSGVCALGGGALTNPDCLEMVISSGPVICLMASYDTLFSRLSLMRKGDRPLLSIQPENQLRLLLVSRKNHYASFPQRIESDGKSPSQVAWEAQTLLGRFHLHQGEQTSNIRTLNDLDAVGKMIQSNPDAGVQVTVVSDDHVAPIFADRVVRSVRAEGFETALIQFPSGEDHKTLNTVAFLWDEFIRLKLDRKSLLIGLGGGVVSDVTGFAAATFLRGIPWAVIPTTLLAMVDASIGGKTGIDLKQGKNLVGSFHFPRQVLLFPASLTTLPEIEFRNGLAEIIKHGIIGDPDLFRICKQGEGYIRANLNQVILKAIAVKIAIVQMDPYETNRRAELNLGHTIGHALEVLSHYELHHGEAVSIGMVVETGLAEKIGMAKPGLTNEVVDVLDSVGLPTSLPTWVTTESLMDAMQMDKKRANGVIRFSLPVDFGLVKSGIEIDHLAERLAL
jgi:shikimate kinase/3-dehydroquinate synthase